MFNPNFLSNKRNVFRLIIVSVFCLSVGFNFAQRQNVKSESENAKINQGETKEIGNSEQASSNIISPALSPDSPPEKTHNLVAAYYDVQNFPTAELLLNNKDIVAREIRPTLYNLDGNILEIAPVTIEANSHRVIDLNEWANLGGESFRQGSLKLFHTGKDLVIGSQIYLADEQKSLSFEERLAELGKFNSRRLEAVWHQPDNQADVNIILSNTSNEMLSVTAKLSRKPQQAGEPQTFALLPHQTRILDLRKDFEDGNQFANSEIVGLTLEHSGENGAIKAHGQIKAASKGYSNIVAFSNPNTAKSAELHGTGLHLGTVGKEQLEPIVAVRNVGGEKTNVTARVPYTRADGTTGTVDLKTVNLKVGEMRLLNMNQVIERSRKEQIEIAGIEVEYDTAAGSVIVNTQSVSENRNLVFRVPMADPFAQVSSTGGYPWQIEETSRTVSYIKNTTDLEQEYVAYLTWENGGVYMIGLEKIAPRKTVQIDVKKLRDGQTPDERGNTIPLSVNYGQIKWTMRSEKFIENQPLKKFELIGRSEQIDTVKGISSSYACQNCCQKTARGSVFPYSSIADIEVGDQIQFGALEEGTNCYYEPYYFYLDNDDVDWDSSEENIATIDDYGLATIVGAGDVEIKGEWDVYVSGTYGGYCPGGPYLTEESKVKTDLEKSADAERMLLPDCNACYTIPDDIGSEVEIEAKPKVTINVPSSANDGDTVTFSATTDAVSPTYLWSFEPTSGGNNPQVNFTAPTSATTEAKAHWFAKPDGACSANPSSTYKIKIKVTFQGGKQTTKEANFTVNVLTQQWIAKVPPPKTEGEPDIRYDRRRSLWVVVGPNSLQRVPNPPDMSRVPETTQFYNKILKHEEVHVEQYATGIYSDLYQIDNLMPHLLPLTDPNQQPLEQKIFAAIEAWRRSQDTLLSERTAQTGEREAYAVSDPIEPRYLFNNCGRY